MPALVILNGGPDCSTDDYAKIVEFNDAKRIIVILENVGILNMMCIDQF